MNLATHGIEEFDGNTFLGRDPAAAVRYFEGHLDDARIYDAALTPDQIDALYQATR